MPNFIKVFVLFVLLGLSFSMRANQDSLILQLHDKYQQVTHYKADFTQIKKVSYISKPLITKGSLEFALGLGLIWQVDQPLWVQTLINDKGVFKTTKYQNKQKVNDLQIKLVSEIMTELLTANLDKIDSQFDIKEVEIKDEDKRWEIKLDPKKIIMKKALKQISLTGKTYINPSNIRVFDDISQIIILDKSDNQTQISLESIIMTKESLSAEIRSRFE